MPEDTTPHGGEALHPLPDRARIPAGRTGEHETARKGPPLPGRSEPTAADVTDESSGTQDDDTGKPSVTRQPGG